MEADPFHDPRIHSYIRVPCMKQFKRQFRRIDLYAMPVTMRYKGEKKFYTNYGAVTSIVIILLMLSYIGSQISVMLE